MKDKYKESIYNLTHLSKAKMEHDGVFIDRNKLEKDIDVLWELYNKYQELVNTTKAPTLEEVKKEWEALGYEWKIPKEYPHMIWLVDNDDEPKWVLTIKINTQSKKYWKRWGDGDFEAFTFQEHKLLTKTFKALGWEE